jgi:hypothetical protein
VDFFAGLDFFVGLDFLAAVVAAGAVLVVGAVVGLFLGAALPVLGVESAAASRRAAADRKARMFTQFR